MEYALSVPKGFPGLIFELGYAYEASRLPDYLPIAVLKLYIYLSVTHTLRFLMMGPSLVCYESGEELVLPAENPKSKTAGTLSSNTSAGIKLPQVLALQARKRRGPSNREVEDN